MQFAEGRQVVHESSGFGPNFVPDGVQLRSHEAVEGAEESVLDCEIVYLELRSNGSRVQYPVRTRTRLRAAHVGIAPFHLRQRELHALENRSLNVEHGRSERLVQLDDVRLALLQILVHVVVEAKGGRLGIRGGLEVAPGARCD